MTRRQRHASLAGPENGTRNGSNLLKTHIVLENRQDATHMIRVRAQKKEKKSEVETHVLARGERGDSAYDIRMQ